MNHPAIQPVSKQAQLRGLTSLVALLVQVCGGAVSGTASLSARHRGIHAMKAGRAVVAGGAFGSIFGNIFGGTSAGVTAGNQWPHSRVGARNFASEQIDFIRGLRAWVARR